MHALIDILSCFCLLTGAIFSVLGGIGLIRFPDFYARLHGGGITDTMGAGMIILGLLLQAFRAGVDPQVTDATITPWLVAAKLLMVLFFLSITSPSSCHALAQAAWQDGLKPQLPNPPDARNDD
jgi:multicomponent Na+:H+ antiporter subunit G